ncbi:MAG: replicative DNA helicase, partial [Oscillospiraceae bacterium]
LLLDPDIISAVLEFVTIPEMFFKQQHRDLFAVLINMFNISKPIDFVTVLDECIKANVFDTQENAKLYLTKLMQIVPSTSNVTDYCIIVQDKYYIRTLINASEETITEATQGDFDAQQILDAAEQRIYNIRQGKDAASLVPIDSVIIKTYDTLQKLTGEDKDLYLGLPTGFTRLDAMMTGLNKSDLILLAARPGMGKTSFALNIATHVAKKTKKDVAIFSLEMSNEQLVSRVLSSEAQIQSQKLRTGHLTTEEWIQLAASAEILSKTHIYLDDSAGITIAEMKAKLRRLKNLGLVVIDYLQLMSTGKRNENRVQEISQMTRNLKIMAKELNIPILLLSQLSRAS